MTARRLVARQIARVTMLAAVLVVIAPGAVGAMPGAAQPELADSGWWHNPQSSPMGDLTGGAVDPLASAPPETAAGELAVAASGDDATAIAAIRFELPRSAMAMTLSLPVRSIDGDGGIVACLAGSGWTGADAGDWSQKPLVDCDGGSVPASPIVDDAITFDVSDLQVAQTVDIILVPTSGSDLEIVFGAPDASMLDTRLVPTSSPTPAPTTSIRPAGGMVPPATVPPPTPRPAPVVTTIPGPAAVALPPSALGRSATSPVERAASSPIVAAAPGLEPARVVGSSPARRVLAAGVGIVAMAYWFLTRGETADAGPRGLGDFRSVRQEPTPKLR